MEEILGGRTNSERFAEFLADWSAILERRAQEAVTAFAKIEGVRGIILAGGVGRGRPWPLSDIDLLPILDDERAAEALADIERQRLAIMASWLDEGWRTGLDIGNLWFSRSEVNRVLGGQERDLLDSLRNDRWYHSLDKGFQGRPVVDDDGAATALAQWLTAHRFAPIVVAMRLERERREIEAAVNRLNGWLDHLEPLAATATVNAAVKWLRIWLLEQWGERDNSLARVGTRFDRLARARGFVEIAGRLNEISDLADAKVEERLAVAPDWVREWHDRSLRARRHVGETVSVIENGRDVLRVCVHYELREMTVPPFPAWLSVIDNGDVFQKKVSCLTAIVPAVGLAS